MGDGISVDRKYRKTTRRGDFLCECGDSLCPEHVPLTADEYDTLPERSPGLALAPGHELSLAAPHGRCRECGGRRHDT
jgi:hypothetical protein